MTRCVVDTNVPIVANGRPDPANGREPTVECRLATVEFLSGILKTGTILVDLEGEVQVEYRRHLSPSGQPGVGDRFYQAILLSAPELIERVELPKGEDGEFEDLPVALIGAGFDPSDRKFAALGRRYGVPIYNATDTDWIEHREVLAVSGIEVQHLCGCNPASWLLPQKPAT